MGDITPFELLTQRKSVPVERLREHIFTALNNPSLDMALDNFIVCPSPEAPQTHVTVLVLKEDADLEDKFIICGILASRATACGYDIASLIPGTPATNMILRRRNP